jgi:hypothetical protein
MPDPIRARVSQKLATATADPALTAPLPLVRPVEKG